MSRPAIKKAALYHELVKVPKKDLALFIEESEALMRGRIDTAFFAEYWLGLKVNRFQRRLFAKIDEQDAQGKLVKGVVPSGNQVGKTAAIAILHIKWAFYKKGMQLDASSFQTTFYQTLNLSPVLRQSKIAMQYVEQILTSAFAWPEGKKTVLNVCKIKGFYKSKNENLGRIEYSNNAQSTFISTSEDQGANIQGAQFGMITYDECVLSGHLADELPSKILSRLAKYGNLLLLIASPKAEERQNSLQYFYRLSQDAKAGRNEFFYCTGHLDDNEFISEHQREEMKRSLNDLDPSGRAYKEVVLGEFLGSAGALFPPHVINAMWNGKQGNQPAREGRKYLIVADWGFADQGDKTAIGVFDYTDILNDVVELVFRFSKKGGEPWEMATMVTLLKREYNDAKFLMDANSMGGTIMRKMLKDIAPIPFNGIGDDKMRAVAELQSLLTKPVKNGIADIGILKSPHHVDIEEEFANYKLDDKKLEQDWVMVFMMAAHYLKRYLKAATPATISMRARFNSLHNGHH